MGKCARFPWIKPSEFVKAMSAHNDMRRLLAGKDSLAEAGPMLVSFWKKFQALNPQHELFQTSLDLARCIPVYLHGDEGTTYKKSAVLIISFQTVYGFGSRKRSLEECMSEYEQELESCGIPVNFCKTGLQTRFLSVVAPKDCTLSNTHACGLSMQEMYQDDDTVWDSLLTLVVSDLAHSAQNGIYTREHGLIHPILLGNKGDWSYLVIWPKGGA